VRRGPIEIVTVGTNPNIQITSTDPAGGGADLGLWIGTAGGSVARTSRRLYLLSSFAVNAHQRARLLGFRQYLTIGGFEPVGAATAGYLLEIPVTTPTWKFSDGNVLWGIRKLPPKVRAQPNVGNQDGLAFRSGQSPALLFETILTGPPYPTVTPPFSGALPGNVLVPELSRFFDIRAPWHKPYETSVPIEGPCTIQLFASVQQTNPGTTQLLPPTTPVFSTVSGVAPEDAFLQTYATGMSPITITYLRIAGSLIFEYEDWAPGGMPKTFRSVSTGDRVTRDTTVTGGNEIRQSGAATSGCGEEDDK